MARQGAAAIAVLLTFFVAATAAASHPPAASQLRALAAVKAGLDPSGSLLSSWKPSRSCASWRGLTCDQLGHVTSMNFGPSFIFTGALVDAIGNLTYLTTLVVRTDGFVPGSVIPVTIAALQRLTKLVLSGYTRTAVINIGYPGPTPTGVATGLFGSLPAGIAALPNLAYLDLHNNFLGGSLPSFAAAKKLAYLDLSGNQFLSVGPFSIGFGGATPTFGAQNSLTYMNLASNNFSAIGSLAVLTKLTYLNLAVNTLRTFDGSAIKSTSLTYLNISTNNLVGPLPDLAHVKSLQSLDLSANPGVNGTLRADYGTLTNLRLLNLTFSYASYGGFGLHGPIPSSYGNLTNLVSLAISCPAFNGTVDEAFPSTLGKLQKLRYLTISAVGLNNVNGIGLSPPAGLPSFVGELTHLRELFAYEFSGNEATGAYPANLVKLQSLTSLTLGDVGSFGKFLNGSLPRFILSLKALQKLDLSRSNFSGRVWPTLGSLKNLRYIDLSDNSLSGSLGDVLNANPNWETVILYATGLSGVLPSSIGSLKRLRYLSLGLLLNGTIPSSFSELTALQYLALSGNNFYGTVPDLSATKLTYLSLASNNFTGALPRLPKTLQILAVGSNHFTSIPDNFKGLNSLIYADFSEAGSIKALPPSLFRLPKLQYLTASNLGLTSLPSDIGSAQALTTLDLSFNGIKQTFPAGIQALKKLNNLYLQSNFFTGRVPDLSSVPLFLLSLFNNSFSGPLPKLGTLANTRVKTTGSGLNYVLNANNFTGAVPKDYLSGLSQLANFDVSHNQLIGPLPEIPVTAFEANLNFSYNSFSGTLPRDFFNRANLSIVDVSYNQLSGPVPDIYDFGFFYPGWLDSNYFTGFPRYLNASNGVRSCISAGEEVPDGQLTPHTSLNCFGFKGTNCTATPQRPAAQCAAFCGDTTPEGPCAGHGVCYLKASAPVCACDHGYSPATRNNVPTCVPGGHHPGHGHHPPSVGHHPSPPPPSGARRLMQQ